MRNDIIFLEFCAKNSLQFKQKILKYSNKFF